MDTKLSTFIYHHILEHVGNSNEIPNMWETKKIEKRKRQKKNNHTHKTVFTWFGNLPTSPELQGFHYYKRKLQCAVTVFLKECINCFSFAHNFFNFKNMTQKLTWKKILKNKILIRNFYLIIWMLFILKKKTKFPL